MFSRDVKHSLPAHGFTYFAWTSKAVIINSYHKLLFSYFAKPQEITSYLHVG